jgi:hypothetical protein
MSSIKRWKDDRSPPSTPISWCTRLTATRNAGPRLNRRFAMVGGDSGASKRSNRRSVIGPSSGNVMEVSLRCRCSHLRGVATEVSPSAGFRFVCYCKDCRAFARFLERPDVLDCAGGTDIFQMPVRYVKLTGGADVLRCLSLSSRVLRWYADCCRTPIANTASSPRFPLVAVIWSFMDRPANGASRDALLGPPRCRIYEGSAIGPLPPNTPPLPSPAFSARRAARVLGWWVRGLSWPNPFFDDRTSIPCSAPRVLTPSERLSAYV